jgi:hypothetical protein
MRKREREKETEEKEERQRMILLHRIYIKVHVLKSTLLAMSLL